MRYLLLICDDPTGEPYDADHDDAGAWVDRLQATGSYVLGDRVRPEDDAVSVRVRDGQSTTTAGPVTRGSERVVGFDVIDAADLDSAVAAAAAHPMARFGAVEVRPVWPMG